MLEATYHPPKYVPREKGKNVRRDINMPSLLPGRYAHVTRPPNTDYHVRLLMYKQRTQNIGDGEIERDKNQLAKDVIDIKYNTHAEKKRLQGQINDRFNLKVKEYEASIDARRERLKELLAADERDFYYLTVENAQRGADKRMDQMKERAAMLRNQREQQRLEVVRQKKIQQYRERCMDLRPYLAQRNLQVSKDTQLQQMRENESRREAERELDTMWYDLMMKEISAKVEREKQDLIHEDNRRRELLETWNMQVQGKELLRQEAERVAEEDRLEMLKLQEELRRERIEALEKKRQERDRCAKELQEQIMVQEKIMAQRKKEEEALEQAISKLTQIELQRERDAIQDTTLQAKREMTLYRSHLKELEKEKKKEEEELLKLLEEHQKAVMQKQLDAKCKEEAAKRKLQQDVMRERAEQLEHKRQQDAKELEQQQEEVKLNQWVLETNQKLKQEQLRRQAEEAKKYREDLEKQIEYNNLLKQREREELERQMKVAKEEEEKYQQMVEGFLKGKFYEEERHPFRKVVERYDCYCPNK